MKKNNIIAVHISRSDYAFVLFSETTTSPTQYHYTKSTTYVDENGAPVSVETVKSGQPVTVYYTKDSEK